MRVEPDVICWITAPLTTALHYFIRARRRLIRRFLRTLIAISVLLFRVKLGGSPRISRRRRISIGVWFVLASSGKTFVKGKKNKRKNLQCRELPWPTSSLCCTIFLRLCLIHYAFYYKSTMRIPNIMRNTPSLIGRYFQISHNKAHNRGGYGIKGDKTPSHRAGVVNHLSLCSSGTIINSRISRG